MKYFNSLSLLFLSYLAIIQAAPPTYNTNKQQQHYVNDIIATHSRHNVPINDMEQKTIRNELEVKNDGNYRYAYETTNGIVGTEEGQGGVAVLGSSSYTSPEGVAIKLSYTADETGYHPVGDHIPQIPDYILRSLEYIRTHPFQVRDYYSGQTKELKADHDAFRVVTAAPKSKPLVFKRQRRHHSFELQKQQLQSNQRQNRGSIKYFTN